MIERMSRSERKAFMRRIRANVREYTENRSADPDAKKESDARLISQDWEAVGSFLRDAFKECSEENEHDEK